MYQIKIIDSEHTFAEFPLLEDAAEVGRSLNKKHRHEYCYIWDTKKGVPIRPEYADPKRFPNL